MSETMPEVPDANPDLDEVLQEEDAAIVVPVKHDGPIHALQLPATRWVSFQTTITDTAVEKLFGRDPRRKRVLLMTADAAFIAGTDRNAVAGSASAFWPENVPLELLSCGPVYVRCRFPGSIALSVIAEYWAD